MGPARETGLTGRERCGRSVGDGFRAGRAGSSAAVLAAPACERELRPRRRALQVVGDLGVDGREPTVHLLGLVGLELGRVAAVPAPEELGHGDVRPAPRALARSEDVPLRAAHLGLVVSRTANLKRARASRSS